MNSKYYGLNEEAINDLVNSSEEVDVVINKKNKIKNLIKLAFIKFWFGGALCYFVLWGLGIYVSNDLDMFVLLAFILAITSDFLLNPIIRYISCEGFKYSKYIFINISYKKIYSLFFHIIYSFIIVFCIYITYVLLNSFIFSGKLGVEPLLFGLIYLVFDSLFVVLKNIIIRIYKSYFKTNP